MNKNIALIIIYNHQYNKNIDVIERIYKDRFSNIYHLVPFYNGEKENVIPVYESSFYFQGCVSQGYKAFFKKAYAHYLFLADDLMLNPTINENNYTEHFMLSTHSCFMPGFITLHKTDSFWYRVGDAFNWNIYQAGVEAHNQLPAYEDAIRKFKKLNLDIGPLGFNQIYKIPESLRGWIRPLFGPLFFRHSMFILGYLRSKIKKRAYNLKYPMVGSYSDVFVLSSDAIKQFSHLCGVFASTKLHVELAVPTSMVLSAKEIKTEADLRLKGKALWVKEDYKELDKYNNSLNMLLKEFPLNYLYLHPIKLSKWNTEI